MVPRATPPARALLRRCILSGLNRGGDQGGAGCRRCDILFHSVPQDSDLVSGFWFPPVRSPFGSTTGNRIAWFGIEPLGSVRVARRTGGQSRRSETIRRNESASPWMRSFQFSFV